MTPPAWPSPPPSWWVTPTVPSFPPTPLPSPLPRPPSTTLAVSSTPLPVLPLLPTLPDPWSAMPTVPSSQLTPLPWLPPGLPTLPLEALSTLWLPCPTPTSTTASLPTPTVPSSLLSPLMLSPPGRHTSLLLPAPRETPDSLLLQQMCEFCSNLIPPHKYSTTPAS